MMTDDDIRLIYNEIEGCCSEADRERIVADVERGREAIQLLHDLVSECSSLALQWEADSGRHDVTVAMTAERFVSAKHADVLRAVIKRVLAKQRGMVGGEHV